MQRLAKSVFLAGALVTFASSAGPRALPQTQAPERWRAWLETPGGELPFGLELTKEDDGWHGELVNEPERIPLVVERRDAGELALSIPPYESRITARLEGVELAGTWTKRRNATSVAEVPFRARPGYVDRFPRKATRGPPARLAGRWAVDFETDELPAVAVFEQVAGERELRGTILTATGDHRYLAGAVDGDELALSCFDGAHAFLYRAKLQPDGTLAGDFWSGNWHHERWTARRDESAALPDAFAQTSWQERASLADLVFPDLAGNPRCLAEPEFAGKATLLVVFGSWCPNCNDEVKFLVELEAKYRSRGLAILGLAFELTGDFAEDSAALRGFAERHGITYPLFLAGTADKGAATEALAALDRVRAYPTTIFLAGDGSVRAVHTGYAGPATGAEHAALRKKFEQRIEELLAEEPPSTDPTWNELCRQPWYCYEDEPNGRWFRGKFEFLRDGSRVRITQRYSGQHGTGTATTDTWEWPVQVRDNIVVVERQGEETPMLLRLDPQVGVLTDPLSFAGRFYREARVPADGEVEKAGSRFLASRGYPVADAERALADPDPRVRREAIFVLVQDRDACDRNFERIQATLADSSMEVRIATTWALGELDLICPSRKKTIAAEPRARAVAQLQSQLGHPNAALRRETLKALIHLTTSPEISPSIEPLVRDLDPLVRCATARALANLAGSSQSARARLEELLDDPYEPVRDVALNALDHLLGEGR